MRGSIFCKLVQRQTYDILSQRHLFLISLVGLLMMAFSMYRISEIAFKWSGSTSNVFSDNIVGQNQQDALCQDVPIDIVYTWVNGSDPDVVRNLSIIRRQAKPGPHCRHKICIPVVVLHSENRIRNDSFPVKYRAGKKLHNATALALNSQKAENIATRGYVMAAAGNVTASRAYITKSTGDDVLPHVLLLIGLADARTEQDVLQTLARIGGRISISSVHLYKDQNVAIVLTSGAAASEMLRASNLVVLGSQAHLHAVTLVLESAIGSEDIETSRFADNDELRYSLRSLEKNAPWVRRVFLVTNGQIPSWLNLNNDKISIVTHQEIFVNGSHLPTFSSPAIETHLHRIPGLSKRFLYLNDDVMFGKRVWPEDFYSRSNGYKVRLAWSVPDCAMGCPTSWIRDGYCDRACNNSQCQWDGGDCQGTTTGVTSQAFPFGQVDINKIYCSSSCANSWLADRYCDKACNVLECAFDAGDCGISNYHLLHGISLDARMRNYYVPPGKAHMYFDLSQLFANDSRVTEGHYQDTEEVRTVAVSLQHKILTVVLRSRKNPARVHITLKGTNRGVPFELPVVVHLNASSDTFLSSFSPTMLTSTTTTTEEPLVFEEFPESQRFPAILSSEELDTPSEKRRGRKLLDTFGDSLQHVNQLYNEAFGFEARKVPSHMAHMIDRDVVHRLQARFPEEFDRTSSHQVRSPDDMQFAFSYFYFLMSEKVPVPIEEVFDTFDVDASRSWSSNEIRTVAATLYDLPLEYSSIQELEELLIGCENSTSGKLKTSNLQGVDSHLPTISREAAVNCEPLVELLRKVYKTKHANKFETVKEEDYVFIMMQNNVSLIVAETDQLRKNPKKFICLNDNIDHSREDAELVKTVVRGLYESLFPTASSFELLPEYRNRFCRIEELRAWQKQRKLLSALINISFFLLMAFTLVSLYQSMAGPSQDRILRI